MVTTLIVPNHFKMTFNSKQRRQLGLAGAVLVLGAGAYALYRQCKEEILEEPATSYTKKPITIVLSESILSSNIPIGEILAKTSEVVVVIPPDLSISDLNEKLDPSVVHKVIECDTFAGVWSVVKHLNGEIVFIVKDDLAEDIPEGLERELFKLDEKITRTNKEQDTLVRLSSLSRIAAL